MSTGFDEMPSTEAWAEALGISREAIELYRASEVIDLHVDSFIWARIFGYDLHARHAKPPLGGHFLGHVDLPRALEAGMRGAIWVITTNPLVPAFARGALFERNLGKLKETLSRHPDVTVVRSGDEYRAARAAGKHGAFLGVQGGNALPTLEDFDRIREDEIIRITLVHLTSSQLGRTSAPSPMFFGTRGLTPYGHAYVERMNEKKILVDLAHIGRDAFFEAVGAHDHAQPLVVTHTGVDAVWPHWRNLTDDQIRAVADTGGTIGVMLQRSFLGRGEVSSATVVDHIEHIVKLVGADHAAIGTDYDGAITPPADLIRPVELPRLVDEMLRRGFTAEQVQKVLGGSFLRVVDALRS